MIRMVSQHQSPGLVEQVHPQIHFCDMGINTLFGIDAQLSVENEITMKALQSFTCNNEITMRSQTVNTVVIVVIVVVVVVVIIIIVRRFTV